MIKILHRIVIIFTIFILIYVYYADGGIKEYLKFSNEVERDVKIILYEEKKILNKGGKIK